MALNTDAKFGRTLIRVFKNDMKNLTNFHRLNNKDFILERKMAELNDQIDQMQCQNFAIPWK